MLEPCRGASLSNDSKDALWDNFFLIIARTAGVFVFRDEPESVALHLRPDSRLVPRGRLTPWTLPTRTACSLSRVFVSPIATWFTCRIRPRPSYRRCSTAAVSRQRELLRASLP